MKESKVLKVSCILLKKQNEKLNVFVSFKSKSKVKKKSSLIFYVQHKLSSFLSKKNKLFYHNSKNNLLNTEFNKVKFNRYI